MTLQASVARIPRVLGHPYPTRASVTEHIKVDGIPGLGRCTRPSVPRSGGATRDPRIPKGLLFAEVLGPVYDGGARA